MAVLRFTVRNDILRTHLALAQCVAERWVVALFAKCMTIWTWHYRWLRESKNVKIICFCWRRFIQWKLRFFNAKWILMMIQSVFSISHNLYSHSKKHPHNKAIDRRCMLRKGKCNKYIFHEPESSCVSVSFRSSGAMDIAFSRFNSWIDLFLFRRLIEHFCYQFNLLGQIDIWTLNDTKIDRKRN